MDCIKIKPKLVSQRCFILLW